ncbi:MAG: hypothetical protein ACXABY_19390 [Candidatus Thorarchaeota archaeon]|jgi:hypothetical protein
MLIRRYGAGVNTIETKVMGHTIKFDCSSVNTDNIKVKMGGLLKWRAGGYRGWPEIRKG